MDYLKKIGQVVFYNLIITLFLLSLCEIGFRLLFPQYQYYQQTYHELFNEKAAHLIDENWVAPDEELGWVCKSNKYLRFYNPDFHNVSYSINDQGFRNNFDFDSLQNPTNKRRILLIGDSFLFGIFLENNQTISAILQKELGDQFEVYNLSIPGWGIDQMHDAYQKYVSIIKPDQVVLLYIDEDISRVAESFYWGASTKRSYKFYNNQLVKRQPTDGKLNRLSAFFVYSSKLVNYFYQSICMRNAKSLAVQLLNNMMISENENKRKLLLMRCPRITQLNDEKPRYDLSDFVRKIEVTYIDIQHAIQQLSDDHQQNLYIPDDGHPSVEGARFISGLMKNQVLVKLNKQYTFKSREASR